MGKKNEKIQELLSRGVEEVYQREHLEAVLRSGKKLRVKHGIDPTGPSIHLGRAVPLLKLREFQELGHRVVLILGDFTAQIGDASDKQARRRPLSAAEVRRNMAGYTRQLGKILDMGKTEVRYNSEWLGKLNVRSLLSLAMHFTAQQMIQRRNFKERWERENPIGLHEVLYPLLQGYDSVAVRADLEIGGSDQLFNLQVGREIQKIMGQKPQDIMTLKMLLGTDGRKMSSSWGNIIAIEDSPATQFGKVMSLRDELVFDYFELCTRTPLEEIVRLRREVERGGVVMRDVKFELATRIVELFHGPERAKKAAREFERVFREKKKPQRMRSVALARKQMLLPDVLVASNLAPSKSEARRLIVQGGVKIDGETCRDWRASLVPTPGMVIQVGKRKFVRVVERVKE